jgi:hypothetical protein
MKKIFQLLLIGFIAIQITSCKKEEVAKVNKTELLTAKPWIINQADFNAGLSATIYKRGTTGNLFEAASKISLAFSKDGKVAATDQNGNAVAGAWSFNADETKITLPKGLPFEEIIIDNLTATNFDVNVPQFSYALLGSVVTGKLIVKMIPKV